MSFFSYSSVYSISADGRQDGFENMTYGPMPGYSSGHAGYRSMLGGDPRDRIEAAMMGQAMGSRGMGRMQDSVRRVEDTMRGRGGGGGATGGWSIEEGGGPEVYGRAAGMYGEMPSRGGVPYKTRYRSPVRDTFGGHTRRYEDFDDEDYDEDPRARYGRRDLGLGGDRLTSAADRVHKQCDEELADLRHRNGFRDTPILSPEEAASVRREADRRIAMMEQRGRGRGRLSSFDEGEVDGLAAEMERLKTMNPRGDGTNPRVEEIRDDPSTALVRVANRRQGRGRATSPESPRQMRGGYDDYEEEMYQRSRPNVRPPKGMNEMYGARGGYGRPPPPPSAPPRDMRGDPRGRDISPSGSDCSYDRYGYAEQYAGPRGGGRGRQRRPIPDYDDY